MRTYFSLGLHDDDGDCHDNRIWITFEPEGAPQHGNQRHQKFQIMLPFANLQELKETISALQVNVNQMENEWTVQIEELKQ